MKWYPHPTYRVSVTESGLVMGPDSKVLKPILNTADGRHVVSVHLGGSKRKRVGIHILVCETFHGPRPPGKQVAHRNGNCQDNRASNLSWKTPRENCADRVLHGTSPVGEKNPAAKVTVDTVSAIRHARAQHPPVLLRDLAERYGISVPQVSSIALRRTWAHIS